MAKLTKSQQVRVLVSSGELDSPVSVPDMLEQSGRLLDKACSHDICGTVLFQAEDKKWYVGTVEFCVGKANPDFAIDEILSAEMSECDNCGHIERSEELAGIENEEERLDVGGTMPAGQCTQCGALSYLITKERATELVKGKKHA